MARMRFTILGCGSSGGVPRIGGLWGECDPENPKNRRTRCSILVERIEDGGTTRVLIDTSPDMREQLLRHEVSSLDAVVYTHSHSDHVNGLDDLRQIVFLTRKRVQVWADGAAQHEIMSRFAYAFVQPEGSSYPPICDLHTIRGPVTVDGRGRADRVRSIRSRPWRYRCARLPHRQGRLPSRCSEDRRAGLGEPPQRSRLLDRRCAAPDTASDPCPSGADARMDRAGAAEARRSHQHAHRHRPCDGRGRDPRQCQRRL